MTPLRADLTCYKGQTFNQNIYFKCQGEPMDLTGYVPKAQIRPSDNSPILIAEFSTAIDESEGKVTLALSSEQTAAIDPGFYAWDLQMVSETDIVGYWIKGQYIVTGRDTV